MLSYINVKQKEEMNRTESSSAEQCDRINQTQTKACLCVRTEKTAVRRAGLGWAAKSSPVESGQASPVQCNMRCGLVWCGGGCVEASAGEVSVTC